MLLKLFKAGKAIIFPPVMGVDGIGTWKEAVSAGAA